MTGVVLRVIMLSAGIIQVVLMVFALAKRALTETLGLMWGLVSVLFILVGLLLNPVEIESYISNLGLIIATLIGLGVLYWAWHISILVSSLIKKNHELAMQVSLLNEERETLSRDLEQLRMDHDSLVQRWSEE